jgi:hypothetical protein
VVLRVDGGVEGVREEQVLRLGLGADHDLTARLVQRVDEVDEAARLVLVLQQEDRDRVDVECRERRREGQVVCWAEGRLAQLGEGEAARLALRFGDVHAAAVDHQVDGLGLARLGLPHLLERALARVEPPRLELALGRHLPPVLAAVELDDVAPPLERVEEGVHPVLLDTVVVEVVWDAVLPSALPQGRYSALTEQDRTTPPRRQYQLRTSRRSAALDASRSCSSSKLLSASHKATGAGDALEDVVLEDHLLGDCRQLTERSS